MHFFPPKNVLLIDFAELLIIPLCSLLFFSCSLYTQFPLSVLFTLLWALASFSSFSLWFFCVSFWNRSSSTGKRESPLNYENKSALWLWPPTEATVTILNRIKKKLCTIFFAHLLMLSSFNFYVYFCAAKYDIKVNLLAFQTKPNQNKMQQNKERKKNRTIWRKTVCYLLSYAVFIFACAHWILASNEPEKSSDTTGYTNKNCMAIAEKWTDRQQQQQQKKENKRIYCHYMWLLLRCEWTHRTGASHIINQPAQRNTKSI